MRTALLVLAALGTLLFGGAFVVSFVDPLLVERAAREIVRTEVERRVGEKIDALTDSRIARFARKALQGKQAELDESARRIREEVPKKVANIAADMLRADCECRKRMVDRWTRAEDEHFNSLARVRDRLTSLIETTYASVARNLMREFRIFTGSNAVAFALLGLVALFKGRAALQLALPAACVVAAMLIVGGLYLFNQDWLHTIVFGTYSGFWYSAYLAAVALLLADITMNRARITTKIVNAVLNVVGSALSAVPC